MTSRADNRRELTDAILSLGRQQLSEVGPGQLSLRAIARELGMVSSAVYRYYPSRDHLITALLVECYDESGSAVEAADDAVRRTRLRQRWVAMAHAFRDWARANFHEYALLYGSPVPGYVAPEETIVPAQRITFRMLRLMSDAAELPVDRPTKVPRAEVAAFAPISEYYPGIPPDRMVRALMAWSGLVGHLTLELFGHFAEGVVDEDTHFAHVVDRLATDLGLP